MPDIQILKTALADFQLAQLDGQLVNAVSQKGVTLVIQRTIITTGRTRSTLQCSEIHDSLVVIGMATGRRFCGNERLRGYL